MLTVVLVVLVIFLFLRSIRATIIPGVAVPISLVGTLGAMYVLGYSLDNLSMMALTICHRIRGGRRHRDDREHLALSGRRRPADAGRAQGRRADWLHHSSRSPSR